MLPAALAAVWALPQLAIPLLFCLLLRVSIPNGFASVSVSASASASAPTSRSRRLPSTMATTLPPCTDPTVESHLRTWLDRIPQRPDGALPPGQRQEGL